MRVLFFCAGDGSLLGTFWAPEATLSPLLGCLRPLIEQSPRTFKDSSWTSGAGILLWPFRFESFTVVLPKMCCRRIVADDAGGALTSLQSGRSGRKASGLDPSQSGGFWRNEMQISRMMKNDLPLAGLVSSCLRRVPVADRGRMGSGCQPLRRLCVVLLGSWRRRINRAGVSDVYCQRKQGALRLLPGFDGSMSGGIVSLMQS